MPKGVVDPVHGHVKFGFATERTTTRNLFFDELFRQIVFESAFLVEAATIPNYVSCPIVRVGSPIPCISGVSGLLFG